MATPRFTLRRLLLIVTASAVLCLLPAVAAQGLSWIVGVATAFFALLVLVVLGILLFGVTSLLGRVLDRSRR